MRAHSLKYFVVLAAFSIFGCGSSGPNESTSGGPEETARVNTQRTTLATIDVGYGTIQFQKTVAANGDTSLSIQEQASAYATSTPLDALLLKQPLTALETFIAIAPDQQPPQELVDSQPGEAKQLGRADSSILSATFDKNAPVEKAVTACLNWVYAAPSNYCYSWGNKLEYQTNGDAWLNVGAYIGDWGHPTGTVTMGVCNATATATSGQVAWSRDGSWNYEGWVSIPAFIVYRWFEYSQVVYGPDCTGSPTCVPNPHWSRYGVHQSGGPVDQLLTGEYIWNNNSNCAPR